VARAAKARWPRAGVAATVTVSASPLPHKRLRVEGPNDAFNPTLQGSAPSDERSTAETVVASASPRSFGTPGGRTAIVIQPVRIAVHDHGTGAIGAPCVRATDPAAARDLLVGRVRASVARVGRTATLKKLHWLATTWAAGARVPWGPPQVELQTLRDMVLEALVAEEKAGSPTEPCAAAYRPGPSPDREAAESLLGLATA